MIGLSDGLSGCKLEITPDGTVRKYSPDPTYNTRLFAQSKKQDFFSKIVLKNISVPKVLGIGEEQGKFYFEMEYVFGVRMDSFLSSADKKQLMFVSDAIISYIQELKDQARPFEAKHSILSKLDQLREKSDQTSILIGIAKEVEKNGFVVPKTMCHGDLTLSNMIFHKNRVFLLDFLDSFVDTFLCDLAKIKQDLFYLWTPVTRGFCDARVSQASRFMWKLIENSFSSDMDTIQFRILDALNILRMEPYIKNRVQVEALRSALLKGRFYEHFDCSNGGQIIPISKF